MENSYGYKIRNLRRQHKQTIEQVAIATGISPSALGMYERGMRNPDTKVLLKIAKYFGVELNFFIDISKNDVKCIENTFEKYDQKSLCLSIAKKRANGNCELCGNRAPFYQNNGEPYLEVYQVQKVDVDVKNNVVLLCPNCNKKMQILNNVGDQNYLRKLLITEEL